MKTTIVAPDEELFRISCDAARRFREGAWGVEVRKEHRDAAFLHPTLPGKGPWPYRIDVWGDPKGRVTVHAHRAGKGLLA